MGNCRGCFDEVCAGDVLHVALGLICVLLTGFLIATCGFVNRDNMRTYTLFLCYSLLPLDCIVTIRDIIRIAYHNGCALKIYTIINGTLRKFLHVTIAFEQQIAMLYVMLSAYLAYKHPFTYQRIFLKRRVIYDFLAILMLSMIYALPTTVFSGTLERLVPGLVMFLINATTICNGLLALLLIIVAFGAVFAVLNFNPGGALFCKRRKFLGIFILHSIPILMLNVPTLINILFVYLILELVPDSGSLIPIFRKINEAVLNIEQYRSIIISACTILLLNSYRMAAVKVIKRAFRCEANKTTKTSPAFVIRLYPSRVHPRMYSATPQRCTRSPLRLTVAVNP